MLHSYVVGWAEISPKAVISGTGKGVLAPGWRRRTRCFGTCLNSKTEFA